MKSLKILLNITLVVTAIAAEPRIERAEPVDDVSPIKSEYETLLKNNYKGPFGPNHLVDYVGFQGAFRNEKARAFRDKYGIYLANIFATNYHELVAEFVYGKTNPEDQGSVTDPSQLTKILAVTTDDSSEVAKTRAKSLERKANSMIKHWVLERYYVSAYPNTKHAASFQRKGISGFEFEVPAAKNFFTFYLTAIERLATPTEKAYAYLPTFLLAQMSPIKDSNELERARGLVDDYSSEDKDLYRLRNAIHNQPSPQVIDQINAYKNPPSSLIQARNLLISYFNPNTNKITSLAKELKLSEMIQTVESLKLQTHTPESRSRELQYLVNECITLKRNLLTTNMIPSAQKATSLILLSTVSQYLTVAAQALAKNGGVTKGVVQTLVSAIYLEGLLTTRNYDAITKNVEAATSNAELAQILTTSFSTAQTFLQLAFQNELVLWMEIDNKMENFIDNTLKSSPLTVFAEMVDKLNGK